MAHWLQVKVYGKQDADSVTVPLTSKEGRRLTFEQLRETARALIDVEAAFTLKYVDSDGDLVTIGSDADIHELEEYMVDEELHYVAVVVKINRNVHQQLRGLVSAISKLTTQVEAKTEETKPPTVADAMKLVTAAVTKWNVAADATELVTMKDDLLLVLGDDEFRLAVETLSATDEYKDLAHTMVTALFKKDEAAMEEVITERFDALLAFAQRLFVERPSLKTVFIRLAKSCVKMLTKYNLELIAGADISDAASVSSVMSSFATVSVEEEERSEVANTSASTPHHFGIICDGCEMAPIVGVRYKSLEVHDFDLCEKCEASSKWVSHEPFIKITDPSRAPKQKRPTTMVHPFVTCDGCEMSPIVGARFKSTSVHDFDLCESCEASSAWTETHGPFVKIDEPSMVRAFKHCFRRGEGKWWKKHHKHHGHHHGRQGCHGKEQHAQEAALSAEEAPPAPPCHPHNGCHGHHWFPGHHGPHGPHGPHGHHGHHGHHHRHHGKRHHHHHGHHGRYRRGHHEAPELQAKFVEDVSIEDGTVVDPSTALCKMWKIENSGNLAWPAGCYMAIQEGSHRFGMDEVDKIELPALNPGDEVIAVANLTAPSVPGRYTSYWRVCNPEGVCFGHRFWIDIIVANVSDDAVMPEATSVATPIDESNATTLPEAIVCDDMEMVEVVPEAVAETVAAAVEEVAERDEDPVAQVVDAEIIEGDGTVEPEELIETVDVADIYEGALAMLESMGFGDVEKNRRLLEAWGGSVVDALNELLSE